MNKSRKKKQRSFGSFTLLRKRVLALFLVLFVALSFLVPVSFNLKAVSAVELINLKFDLGGKGAAAGFTGVSATESYSKDKGYGFYQTSLARNVDAGGTGALSDAVHFQGANGHFMVDLPEGVYKITVTTGNVQSATIEAEGISQLYFMTGNNAVDSFTIPVTDGCLDIYASHGVGDEFSISTLEIEQTSSGVITKPTIWLCGDSTVASYYNVSEDANRGWGEYLKNYVDTSVYDIRNLSISGMRSGDLKNYGFLTAEKYGKTGDIIILAVGINDYTDELKNHPNAIDSSAYVSNMTEMARRAKEKGMTVYLAKQHGELSDWKQYPLMDNKWFSKELDSIAASENVRILDMFHPWLEVLLEKGYSIGQKYYGSGIHLNKLGADKMAEIVAEQLFPSAEEPWSSYVDPYPGFEDAAKTIYEAEPSGEIITNPHKGYVMEVHNVNMLYPGKHYLGIDGSEGNKAWDVISTCSTTFRWEDLNPEEGVYDFSQIDTMLEACEQAGYTFALRIMPYSTGTGSDDNYGETHDFVPQWVYDKGAKKDRTTYKYGKTTTEIDVPNWSDPIYNQAYKDFITALAAEYDNDPRVEYIENRAFGNFGEWHASEFTNNDMPSVEIQKSMLDHFAACFKKTTVCVFNDARELSDYAISLGFSKRNDGMIMAPNTEWEMRPSYRANVPNMGDNHNTYENMLKQDNVTYLRWTEEHYREALEIAHMTYYAIDQDSGCGLKFYREQKDLIDEMCNRLGYNFTVTSASRNGNQLKVVIKNTGLAPAFFDFDLCAEITDANGNKIESFGDPIRIEKGTFHDGDERAYLFEYNGTVPSDATICLAMYDRGVKVAAKEYTDPTVRFDNKNNLANNRLKLVETWSAPEEIVEPGTGEVQGEEPGTGEQVEPGTGEVQGEEPGTGEAQGEEPGTGEVVEPGTGEVQGEEPGTGEEIEPGVGTKISTITFDLDGGTLDGQTSFTIEAEEGSTITIPTSVPEREGYTFDYWKGSEYYPGDTYVVSGDHTLTAIWKLNQPAGEIQPVENENTENIPWNVHNTDILTVEENEQKADEQIADSPFVADTQTDDENTETVKEDGSDTVSNDNSSASNTVSVGSQNNSSEETNVNTEKADSSNDAALNNSDTTAKNTNTSVTTEVNNSETATKNTSASVTTEVNNSDNSKNVTTQTPSVPSTKDSTKIVIWITLMVLSVFGVVWVIKFKQHKKDEYYK